jgi:hypothetical protein
MANQVNEKTAEMITRASTFSNTTNRVYSWLELGEIDAAHQVEWRWISPEGSLYDSYTDKISEPDGEPWDWYDIYAYIPIAGQDAAKMPGNWHVDVYLDGQKRITEQFTILGQTTSSQSLQISPETNPSSTQTNSSLLPNLSVPEVNIKPPATEQYTHEITGYVKYIGGNVVRMGVDVKLQEIYNGNVFDIAGAVSSRQNGSFKIIYSSDKLQNPDKPNLIIQAFSGGKPFSNPMEIAGGTNEIVELICSP